MPLLHNHDGWQLQLLEHRAALLERLIREFPQVMTTHRSQIDMWRFRLGRTRIKNS
jgi:hypothetical protein